MCLPLNHARDSQLCINMGRALAQAQGAGGPRPGGRAGKALGNTHWSSVRHNRPWPRMSAENVHWMSPFKMRPTNAAPPEVGIAIAPGLGMRSLRPAAGVLIDRLSGRAGARARAQWALSMNAYENAYSIFRIVQPRHKRQATASNGRFLLQ